VLNLWLLPAGRSLRDELALAIPGASRFFDGLLRLLLVQELALQKNEPHPVILGAILFLGRALG
jgi:hypothetical protein